MAFLPEGIRNHMVAAIAELAGTFLFLFFALSIAQVANTPAPKPGALPDNSKIFFIATGFGCSVAVNVWIFYRVSGGMFNPAV
jgi:aquaporin rerated protein, other eukaryote